jgi:site-specific DNA recombinase
VGIGQHQVLQSRQKSIGAKRVRAERGLFCGGVPPLGYDVDQKTGQYIINEHEAAGVRKAFEMYANGRSYTEIIATLTAMGVRGKKGVRLSNNTLFFILHNERYTGKFTWFERENRHMGKWVGKPGREPVVIEGIIPPLVDRGTWSMVQRRLNENKRLGYGRAHDDREYLLSGLIRCGECGDPLFGHTAVTKGRDYKSYICQGKRKEKNCTLKNIRGIELEEAVAKYVRGLVFTPRIVEAMADRCMTLFSEPVDLEPLRSELASVKQKVNNLLQGVENGIALSPAIVERINAGNVRISQIEEQLVEASAAAAIAPTREEIVKILNSDAEAMLDAGRSDRELIIRYVDSVVVFSDRVEVNIFPEFLRGSLAQSTRKSLQLPDESCRLRGSSGRTRTYNPSVNSRMLCH